MILNVPFNSRSVLELFNTLKWIPFHRESHINQFALVHKRLKGNTPNNNYCMNKLLVTNSSMHMRNTRYCNNIKICFVLDIIMPRRVVVLLKFALLRIGTLLQDL